MHDMSLGAGSQQMKPSNSLLSHDSCRPGVMATIKTIAAAATVNLQQEWNVEGKLKIKSQLFSKHTTVIWRKRQWHVIVQKKSNDSMTTHTSQWVHREQMFFAAHPTTWRSGSMAASLWAIRVVYQGQWGFSSSRSWADQLGWTQRHHRKNIKQKIWPWKMTCYFSKAQAISWSCSYNFGHMNLFYNSTCRMSKKNPILCYLQKDKRQISWVCMPVTCGDLFL